MWFRTSNMSSLGSMSRSMNSSYPLMPSLNQYYSGFPDFLSSSSNPFNYSSKYSFNLYLSLNLTNNWLVIDIDMSSAFDQLFRQSSDNRDVSVLNIICWYFVEKMIKPFFDQMIRLQVIWAHLPLRVEEREMSIRTSYQLIEF